MAELSTKLRRLLERAVIKARDVAEDAAVDALDRLAVSRAKPHDTMTDNDRQLRVSLREEARRLGDSVAVDASAGAALPRLAAECAYEHWHRILFSRFLAENRLLMHPDLANVSVTIDDCRLIAEGAGGSDGWMVAAQFAQKMLPGIFRNDDPILQVQLAPERRQELERLAQELPPAIFTSDDGLGWVYQFWQKKRKKQVNKAGQKIGGDDLCAVTQLFTEDYMVKFLLHNTLGAWWVNRHPHDPLPIQMEYLRRSDDGSPAAGGFEGWPNTAAEITIMDPCCGSGHFLVAAFEIMVAFRRAEEGLSEAAASDAVIRSNLHGLELDPRCTQISAFNLILTAWKHGGYRRLPIPEVACSGLRDGGRPEEWQRLALRDNEMSAVLLQLFTWFQMAPLLGSLIDPAMAEAKYTPPNWGELLIKLTGALDSFKSDNDPASAIFGEAALGAVRAANMLFKRYSLVCTNVPYLARGKQNDQLRDFCLTRFALGKADIATAFLIRCIGFSQQGTGLALVTPQNWHLQPSYEGLRRDVLECLTWRVVSRLGRGAFQEITGEEVKPALQIFTYDTPSSDASFVRLDVALCPSTNKKAAALRTQEYDQVLQSDQLRNPDARVVLKAVETGATLGQYASSIEGLTTGDLARFVRQFWELDSIGIDWVPFIQGVTEETHYGGRSDILRWEGDQGLLKCQTSAHNFPSRIMNGREILGKNGIRIAQSPSLACTFYSGEVFGKNAATIVPHDIDDLSAIWCYCTSSEYRNQVRAIDGSRKVTNGTLLKTQFDLLQWRTVAQSRYPNGLPDPESSDPTQWLFHGHPADSDAPLQVGMGRLLGFRWPEHGLSRTQSGQMRQDNDGLSKHSDSQGIVCLPAVCGQLPAAERLRALLTDAYNDDRIHERIEAMLSQVGFGGKGLDHWLRNGFFVQHCQLFGNRPFLWHIWDGHPQGFSAIVNYHRLDNSNLQTLIYTYLERWIGDQREADRRGEPGANGRLVKALELNAKLEAILNGESPYDIYVRWRQLHEQPIGWDPDLNDGVRVNIRPFYTTVEPSGRFHTSGPGVLRDRFSVDWNKDPGRENRLNDVHLSRAEKEAARMAHQAVIEAAAMRAATRPNLPMDAPVEAIAGETNLFGIPVEKDLFGGVVDETTRRPRR